MSSTPTPGDEVPEDVRQELIDAIESDRRLFPRRILLGALDYARLHLDIEHPTSAALWDYILECLRVASGWRYAQLDDYPVQLGYAMKNADVRGLYLKLRFDDESRVIVMSFHN
jgi:hypothetical protein